MKIPTESEFREAYENLTEDYKKGHKEGYTDAMKDMKMHIEKYFKLTNE